MINIDCSVNEEFITKVEFLCHTKESEENKISELENKVSIHNNDYKKIYTQYLRIIYMLYGYDSSLRLDAIRVFTLDKGVYNIYDCDIMNNKLIMSDKMVEFMEDVSNYIQKQDSFIIKTLDFNTLDYVDYNKIDKVLSKKRG